MFVGAKRRNAVTVSTKRPHTTCTRAVETATPIHCYSYMPQSMHYVSWNFASSPIGTHARKQARTQSVRATAEDCHDAAHRKTPNGTLTDSSQPENGVVRTSTQMPTRNEASTQIAVGSNCRGGQSRGAGSDLSATEGRTFRSGSMAATSR